MQSVGEGLGDALRTFKQAVADVRNSVDPEIRTIQAEMDSAQKEFQQSIEAAKELPALHEEPPKHSVSRGVVFIRLPNVRTLRCRTPLVP